MTKLQICVLVLITLGLAALRVAGHRSDVFAGAAHVFLVLYLAGWIWGRSRLCGTLFGALTVVEAVCFVAQQQ